MILFLQWNAANEKDIEITFEKLGAKYETYRLTSKDGKAPAIEDDDLTRLNKRLKSGNIDAVFNVDTYPKMGRLCHEYGIPYICWAYDSPVEYDDLSWMSYDTTYLFLFDENETERIRKGMESCNVYHLPLAVNTERLDSITPSMEKRKACRSEVSFVGSLYANDLDTLLYELDPYTGAYIDAAINAQLNLYGGELVNKMLTADIMSRISCGAFKEELLNIHPITDDRADENIPAYVLWDMIMKAVTRKERLLILGMLAKSFDTSLYSHDTHEILKNVRMHGRVDYYSEMPIVFKCTEINLNISFRSIISGIPLRCLDIMGCRGFMLSNYQPELTDYFKDGESCAIYTCPEEAYEKCSFYLKHEDERKRAALCGYETVKKGFRYDDRLRQIFGIVGIRPERWKI